MGQEAEADLSAYAHSSDHRPSAQGNLMGAGAGGHAPAWHGGAPVTQEYADAVGADGYAADASTAVRRAKDLIARKRAAAVPA